MASIKLILENNHEGKNKNIEKDIAEIKGYLEQILYYSRSDEVSNDYIIKETTLNIPIKNVLKKKARDCITKNIRIEFMDLEYTIYTDTKWIEFIIGQIVSNSIKYCTKNYVVSWD